MKTKILENEANDWFQSCSDHPSIPVARACLDSISPYQFWSSADRYSDPLRRLHVQTSLMGNFGLNNGVTSLPIMMVDFVFFAKAVLKMSVIFLWIAQFRDNFESLWWNLSQENSSP